MEEPVSGVGASIVSFKILLVEHDTAAAERIGGALRGAGHQLFTEADTARVLESLDRLRPDVALVADGLPGMPGAALCMRLKKTAAGASTPVVFMTAEMPQGEEELSRRLELLGCDRIIDQQTSSEQLLEVCRQVVDSETKREAPKRGPSGQVITQELPKVGKATNRDAPSAASFDDAMRSAFTDSESPSDGLDIEAHLDSVFSMGLPGETPAPTPAPSSAKKPAPEKAAARPAQPARNDATGTPPVVRPVVPAQEASPAPKTTVARPAETKPAAPQAAAPKPAPAPGPTRPQTQAVPKPAETVQPVARLAPKAVEQLRLPRVPEIAQDGRSAARRWLWPVVGLVGATVVLGSLAVGYLVFLGGNDDSSGDAQVAQASLAAPTRAPAPVPAPVVEEEPDAPEALPEPPPLDDATSPVDPSASVKSTPPDVAPVKIASAPPKPQPRAATPPPKTEQVRRPETDRAAVAAVKVDTPPPPAKPETAPKTEVAPKAVVVPKTEAAPSSASPSTKSAPAPEPVPVPQATTPPQPEPTLRPEPSTPTPAEPTAPPAAPVLEKAEPQPAVVVPPVAAAPVVAPPEVLQRVEPSYSAKAVKGLDNPVITLRVLVDQQGKIARVLVEEGIPGSELEGAAISAVLRWRFRPATEDGVPVKAWTNVRFVFQK